MRGIDESGTRNGVIPAANAALIPWSESSITTHSPGSRPSRAAASRKMSGAGLPCTISSPPAMTSKASTTPARLSWAMMPERELELPTASGTRSPRAQASRSRRPGLTVTGSARA
jgi:hypothetical protein